MKRAADSRQHTVDGGSGMMARARRQNPLTANSLIAEIDKRPAVVLPEDARIHVITIGKHSEAVCIGCGCSDSHACVTGFTLDAPASGLQGCSWLRVDYELGLGVCSECVEHVEAFEERVLESRGKGQVARVKAG